MQNLTKNMQNFFFVHDVHLEQWALRKAIEINKDTFKTSDSWIDHFKRRHGLYGRKVTKLITQREVAHAHTINNSANNFINKVKKCFHIINKVMF